MASMQVPATWYDFLYAYRVEFQEEAISQVWDVTQPLHSQLPPKALKWDVHHEDEKVMAYSVLETEFTCSEAAAPESAESKAADGCSDGCSESADSDSNYTKFDVNGECKSGLESDSDHYFQI